MKSLSYDFKNSRAYWLAFVVFCGLISFGYDTGVAGGVIAQDAFIDHFFLDDKGNIDADKVTNVSGNVVSVLQAGAFFGSLGSAPISSRLGRRRGLISFSLIFMLGAILQLIAGVGGRGLGYIYAGRVVAGIGIGGLSAICPAFVSECAPKEVRGRFTGLFQILVVFGVMLSYFVNFGVSRQNITGPRVWQIPFGVQVIPAGMMAIGLLFTKESPRWLASRGRTTEALETLAYLRKESVNSQSVRDEMAEIEAAIEEERKAQDGLSLKEIYLGKGHLSRFVIAFFLLFFQQWTGQNSVNYFAPQMFEAIGYHGATQSLLASGVYGIVKVVSTTIFIFFFVERLGRKTYLALSSLGCGITFYVIGAILKTYPPSTAVAVGASPSSASKAMAALLYIFDVTYSVGWGPLPWVYVAEIFSHGTRHHGLAVASGSQWLWNFVVSRLTPNLIASLGWKIFILYGTIDIGAMFAFSLMIPETRGKSLEEMDIIFGTISQAERDTNIMSVQRVLELDDHDCKTGEACAGEGISEKEPNV
ncbi:sugar transporter [Fomitiporia mediterranea MF3/22]|uniref:sugar transporter n=1 Tax=Fomitiporia mediterranea (strain MF3/22) TaxID=694068 RepID=UPI0004407A39|nr:sugar transporter [Fomitiporia mediterranea MF3/22]EJD00168.1 sugar transporter [Fomitiporia mediterranea MF3/22]